MDSNEFAKAADFCHSETESYSHQQTQVSRPCMRSGAEGLRTRIFQITDNTAAIFYVRPGHRYRSLC